MTESALRPEHYRDAVVAHLMVDDAAAAIDFYAQALGATELLRIARPDGRILHAEVSVEGWVFMLGDADDPFRSPRALEGTTVALHVYVADVDARLAQAVMVGALALQTPQDMFYGARTAMLRDPFGHVWVLLTHQHDLTLDEITRRGQALLAGGAPA